MNVKLLTYTNEPEKIVAAAAKLCYAKSDIGTLMDNLTDDKICEFLDRLSNLGHSSPTEHASFTFGIEGVSRSFLAQISRHRLASLSVQSQRYVDMTNAGFVMPEEFADDEPASKTFEDAVGYALESYDGLRKYLTVRYIQSGMDAKSAEKKAQEDEQMLRLVYPIAPHLFKNAGPSCVCGACPEGAMSCGKAVEMRQKYTEIKTLHSTEV